MAMDGQRSAGLLDAPVEVLRLVAAQLNANDLAAARLVCRSWHRLFSAALTTLRPRNLGPQLLAFPNLEQLGPPRALWQWPRPKTDETSRGDADTMAQGATASDHELCPVSVYSALAALTQLRHLDCSGSRGLSDEALCHLSALSRLTALDISASSVRGPGLRHLAALRMLRTLNLRSLPRLGDVDIISLSHLGALEELQLDWCRSVQGSGLGSLSRLPRLQRLSLQQCGVDNTGLLAIATLSTLTRLKLDCSDELSDGGVAALASLTRLQMLSLADCPNLRGHGLQELSALTALTALDVSDRCFPNDKRLSASGFAAIGRLASLRSLNVGLCGLGDEHVQALSGLAQLTQLIAHHSDDLTCSGAKQLALSVPSLHHLDLHQCAYLGDEGVAALATLPHLRHLALHGCRGVGDASVAALAARATALTWLGLGHTGARALAPLQALLRLAHVEQ